MERMDQTLTKLRELITGEGIDGNGRIPPERILANELGVGRRSLRRAGPAAPGELRTSRPRPGSPKTCSVITTPPSSVARSIAWKPKSMR